jgi:hypothetical protein
MKKCNRSISIFTFIFLVASFLFAPVNLVMADEASSEKTTADSDKDADKEKKEKAKGKDDEDEEEEPECE